MKYVSIDIETTGLNPFTDNIIEIGAIVEDTKLKLDRNLCPKFHVYINRIEYVGNLYALAMNGRIFQKMVELKNQIDTEKKNGNVNFKNELVSALDVATEFKDFLTANGIEKVIPAGKNFGSFDLQFLKRLPDFDKIRIHHRVLDPAMLYLKFDTDLEPLDLLTCKQRAGITGEVAHESLDDAWDVIQLLRRFY